MRLVAAFLVLALGACSDAAQDTPEPLDRWATLACADFYELTADYDSLDEDERRDLLFEMWDNAQFSETTGIRRIGRHVLDVVIEEKESLREVTFSDMRQACEGRASPYRVIGSND
jgi:hypothetical protein